MTESKEASQDLSEGECSDGSEEDLDTSACKVCNLTFKNPKAFYSHIYSISHLQKTSQNLSSTSTASTTPATPLPSTTTLNMPAVSAVGTKMCMRPPPPPPPCPPPPPPPPVERPEPVSQNFGMFDSHAVTMSDMYSMSMFHPIQSTMPSLFSPANYASAFSRPMAMQEMQYMYSSQSNIPLGSMPLPRPPRMSEMTPHPPQVQSLMSLSTSPWKNPRVPVPEVASSISHVPSLFSLPVSSMHSGNLVAPPPPPPPPSSSPHSQAVMSTRTEPVGVPAPTRPQSYEVPVPIQPQSVGVSAPTRPQPVARPEPVPAPIYLQPYGVSATTQHQPVGVPPPLSLPAAVQSSLIPLSTSSEMIPVSSSLDSSLCLSADKDSELPLIKSEMKAESEPIIEGHWIVVPQKAEDSSESFTCQHCSVTCTGKLLYDLHMAGLRHIKNTTKLGIIGEASTGIAESSVKQKTVSDIIERNTNIYQSPSNFRDNQPPTDAAIETSNVTSNIGKKMKLNDFVERNVDLYKQLNSLVETPATLSGFTVESTISPHAAAPDVAAAETVGKKMTVANILERNVDLLQKLSCYVEPVLGTDYITEYRFTDGHAEHVCHLCETTLSVPVNLTEHSSSVTHLIRYIFYHEPSSFQLLADAGQCSDKDAIYRVAAEIEKKSGRQLRTRLSLETVTPTEFGQQAVSGIKQTHWVEQKDDLIRPLSGLPGHALNAPYSYQHPPDNQSAVKDFPSLLQALGRQSCCASGKPPSLAKAVSRMDLLSSLAVFDVSNDTDAEVSLQIANALTLALLSYRMQMLPTLRPMDRLKFEPKISKLYEEAELVGAKTGARNLSSETTTVVTS